jgi:hypothetical protein
LPLDGARFPERERLSREPWRFFGDSFLLDDERRFEGERFDRARSLEADRLPDFDRRRSSSFPLERERFREGERVRLDPFLSSRLSFESPCFFGDLERRLDDERFLDGDRESSSFPFFFSFSAPSFLLLSSSSAACFLAFSVASASALFASAALATLVAASTFFPAAATTSAAFLVRFADTETLPSSSLCAATARFLALSTVFNATRHCSAIACAACSVFSAALHSASAISKALSDFWVSSAISAASAFNVPASFWAASSSF